jgi:hypothetical protein
LNTNTLPRRAGIPLCALALTAGLAVVPSPAAAKSFGDRPLRPGSHGHDVRVLQSWLTKLGHPTVVDGRYGRGTRRSVRHWERSRGRHVNGRVSRREARAIRRAIEKPRTTTQAPATTTGTATLAADGRTAVAPEGASAAVRGAIAAGNRINRRPYRYGGGHARFRDTGYDCSGAVSYVLHGAGLLDSPRDSTGLMSWGRAGAGGEISVYANRGHAYVIVAGLRFDTSGRGEEGPRWRPERRTGRGYVIRHAAGH